MIRDISRRAVLTGLAAAVADRAVARPAPRATVSGEPETVEGILARSGLGALSGFVLMDPETGGVLEAHRGDVAFPPASVAKVVTALYALGTLGAEYRFSTRLIGTGPVSQGVLRGDLALVGAGDPLLDTDALGGMAAELAAAGVRRVSGRLMLAGEALPEIARIDADQPDGANYNPTISGLNVNFNRVFLRWAAGATGPAMAFSAPGERFDAGISGVRGAVTDTVREPLHRMGPAGEIWLLPRGGMGAAGSLWLPVRAPLDYAGEVFRGLAGQAGVDLPGAAAGAAPEGGGELVSRRGDRLEDVLRGMLYHSTNLTAEVSGLRASQMRGLAPADLEGSAAAMTDWARGALGLEGAVFVNHSGLSERTRISPRQQVGVLAAARDKLPGLLRERGIADGAGGTLTVPGARVVSKTGTLDFVSALAGYVEMPGRRLAFAIFAADPGARAAIRPDQRADPPGAKAWAGRARAQQQALLRRWVSVYAG